MKRVTIISEDGSRIFSDFTSEKAAEFIFFWNITKAFGGSFCKFGLNFPTLKNIRLL